MQLVFLEGERLICDSVRFGANIESIYIKEGYKGKMPSADNIFTITAPLFDKIADTQSPQGIIATAKMPFYSLSKIKNGVSVICDNVRDPGNLGTIIRTAHAVGASAVIMTHGTVDPYNMKTVRSSMGSVFALPVLYADIEAIDALQKTGVSIYSGMPAEDSVSLYDLSIDTNCAFVIGNEGDGVSLPLLQLSDRLFTIPMPGGAESLNAAVAASVCLYEYLRQNNK